MVLQPGVTSVDVSVFLHVASADSEKKCLISGLLQDLKRDSRVDQFGAS